MILTPGSLLQRYLACLLFGLTLSFFAVSTASAQDEGTYRFYVKATGKYLHEDGRRDKIISTRWQSDDEYTHFTLEKEKDGSFRIKVADTKRYLHEDGNGDKLLSTRFQPDDEHTRFIFEPQIDGTYRIKTKANGRFWHVDGNGDKLLSTRWQPTDGFTRFALVPSPTTGFVRWINLSQDNLFAVSGELSAADGEFLFIDSAKPRLSRILVGDSGTIVLDFLGKCSIYNLPGRAQSPGKRVEFDQVEMFTIQRGKFYTFYYKDRSTFELREGNHEPADFED
jgi:hypothetical protein